MNNAQVNITARDRRNVELQHIKTAPKKVIQQYIPQQKQRATSDRLESIQDEFRKGLVLSYDDVIALTNRKSHSTVKNIIKELIDDCGLDLVTITRRGRLIGWVLADEIL